MYHNLDEGYDSQWAICCSRHHSAPIILQEKTRVTQTDLTGKTHMHKIFAGGFVHYLYAIQFKDNFVYEQKV